MSLDILMRKNSLDVNDSYFFYTGSSVAIYSSFIQNVNISPACEYEYFIVIFNYMPIYYEHSAFMVLQIDVVRLCYNRL